MVPTLAGGTTLLVQSAGYQCITLQPQPVAGFDPGKDLKPLGHPIDAPQLMVVRSNFPANAFAEFLQYAKANPGKVTTPPAATARCSMGPRSCSRTWPKPTWSIFPTAAPARR